VHADRVDELIARLADPDATVRQKVENELTAMGERSRSKLVEACRSDSPAIASAASRVLMAMAWFRVEDPTAIKQKLADYGRSDEPGRIRIVSEIASEMERPGVQVLLRLIVEDPSEDVCWKIVTSLQRRRDARTLELVRRLDPPDSRSAALVLVARAWEFKDRNRAVALLNRAIEAESRRQSFDDGELDYAFELLIKAAIGRQEYDEAARLRREQAARIGVTRDSYPSPVFHLFALHGNYGPLAGFEDDVQKFQQYLAHPQVMYGLSKAYQRAGRPLEAQVYADVALVSSIDELEGTSVGNRYLVMRFLGAVGWDDLVQREAYAVLSDDAPKRLEMHLQARVRLAEFADAQQDDARAVLQFQAARELIERIEPDPQSDRLNAVRWNVAWRKAKLAHARGQLNEANKHIDELMTLKPLESDDLHNAYNVVKSLGRSDDAQKLFDDAYKAGRERVEQEPANPEGMNNLAWLCARCDQKLGEALELASNAVKEEPDNAAYLDTLAEVQFRIGRAYDAIALETRAIELEPEQPFMKKQLERFRAGAK
jgi:tetratricopeptide (TPR) repeat protein